MWTSDMKASSSKDSGLCQALGHASCNIVYHFLLTALRTCARGARPALTVARRRARTHPRQRPPTAQSSIVLFNFSGRGPIHYWELCTYIQQTTSAARNCATPCIRLSPRFFPISNVSNCKQNRIKGCTECGVGMC